jgi:hypothetical protein
LNDNSKNISLLEEPSKSYFETIATNYITEGKNFTSFENAKKQYERYKEIEEKAKESALEKIVETEKRILDEEKFSKPFYLTEDSLTACIKQAYKEISKEGKKWPKEFDKRLFRLMLKQESEYNVHAVSPTGHMGLGQEGFDLIETLRPEKWNKEFKDSVTGKIDTFAIKRYLFNPVENIKLSLEGLEYGSKFCKKYDANWKNSDLETKRKKILFCYNAGIGTAKRYNFDSNIKELPKENREYPELIMDNYYDPDTKIKL